jgi:hypothetical protein
LAGWTINGFKTEVQAPVPVAAPAPAPLLEPVVVSEEVRPTVPAVTPERKPEIDAGLRGIAGWLALLAFGIVVAPIRNLIGLTEVFPVAWNLPDTYSATVRALLYAESLANIGLLAASAYLLYLLVKHKQAFPKAFIAIASANLIISITDLVAVDAILNVPPTREDYKNLTVLVLYMLIWIPYVLLSKRVRATFVK